MALSWKSKFAFSLALVVAAFLAGYVPGALETQNLGSEIAAVKGRLRVVSLQGELGMVLIEAENNNFGIAREHSTRFFDQVRDLVNATEDEAVKAKWQAILDRRDEIGGDLASFNPEIGAKLQAMFRELYVASER